jgi:hypothetical protein
MFEQSALSVSRKHDGAYIAHHPSAQVDIWDLRRPAVRQHAQKSPVGGVPLGACVQGGRRASGGGSAQMPVSFNFDGHSGTTPT